MPIDTARSLVFQTKGIEDLLHVDMGHLGAHGQVRQRLAPVFEVDPRPGGAAGQVKHRRQCEVTIMERQIRGHIVQGLIGHQHRLALKVYLGIDPRVSARCIRGAGGASSPASLPPLEGRWAGGAPQRLQVTHIQVAREKRCPHQGPLLLPLHEDVPPQIAGPQGSGEPPYGPDVPFLRQMARQLRGLLAWGRLSVVV